MKIQVYPMDYEEFCAATGNNYALLEKNYEKNKAVGQQINRKLMRDIRIFQRSFQKTESDIAYPQQSESEKYLKMKI